MTEIAIDFLWKDLRTGLTLKVVTNLKRASNHDIKSAEKDNN